MIALLLLQESTLVVSLVVSLRSSCNHQSQVVDAASHPLSSLEGATSPSARSGHAAHVARHHPTVVTTAREHGTLVLANASPEAAVHARVQRHLVPGPLLSLDVVLLYDHEGEC